MSGNPNHLSRDDGSFVAIRPFHHPHLRSIRGRSGQAEFVFVSFTGVEPEPSPQYGLWRGNGLSEGDLQTLAEEYRQARNLWLAAAHRQRTTDPA
jgi:hypothetical protein